MSLTTNKHSWNTRKRSWWFKAVCTLGCKDVKCCLRLFQMKYGGGLESIIRKSGFELSFCRRSLSSDGSHLSAESLILRKEKRICFLKRFWRHRGHETCLAHNRLNKLSTSKKFISSFGDYILICADSHVRKSHSRCCDAKLISDLVMTGALSGSLFFFCLSDHIMIFTII